VLGWRLACVGDSLVNHVSRRCLYISVKVLKPRQRNVVVSSASRRDCDCQDAGPHPPRHAAKKDSMINEH
jgi:hypothetical protein